jgi:hypothetical protein
MVCPPERWRQAIWWPIEDGRHWPLLSANDDALASDPVRRVDANRLDAAGVDSEAVLKRGQVEVAMYRAELVETGPASGQGKQAPTSRRLAGHRRSHREEAKSEGNPDSLGHIPVLKMYFSDADILVKNTINRNWNIGQTRCSEANAISRISRGLQ